MTARGGTPSPQWERFVVTDKARARVRSFIDQEQRQQSRDAGKVELTKAFRQAGVDGSEKALEPALKALKFASVDDLYVAVGTSDIVAQDVVYAAYPAIRRFIDQEQRQESRDAGKVELTKAFRQAGLDGSEKMLEPALKALKFASVDELYIAVGYGEIVAQDVVYAAYPIKSGPG